MSKINKSHVSYLFLPCGLVPNDSRTSTSPRPVGWETAAVRDFKSSVHLPRVVCCSLTVKLRHHEPSVKTFLKVLEHFPTLRRTFTSSKFQILSCCSHMQSLSVQEDKGPSQRLRPSGSVPASWTAAAAASVTDNSPTSGCAFTVRVRKQQQSYSIHTHKHTHTGTHAAVVENSRGTGCHVKLGDLQRFGMEHFRLSASVILSGFGNRLRVRSV